MRLGVTGRVEPEVTVRTTMTPMKSPGRKRPLSRRVAPETDPALLERCAESATYVGSPEHKSFPSFAGAPKLRSDATRCPTHLKDADQITLWLREAIRAGNVSDLSPDSSFPRYVWAFHEGLWFEGRVTNAEQGWYKGYPLAAEKVPLGATP